MPQRIRDFGVAALALAAVFAALTGIDRRVPAEVMHTMTQVANGSWLEAGSPVGSLLVTLSASPALDNVLVAGFLAAGVVLVILMVRT